MHNWSFVDNTVHEVNYATASTPGDVIVDNSVPVFVNSAPTTKCVPFAQARVGAAVQSGLNISGNVFTQISGTAAVDVYSTDGIELRGNTITRESGSKVPAVDLQGNGVVGAVLGDNMCDGRACVASGFGP